jgi:uncharacterized membrane protein
MTEVLRMQCPRCAADVLSDALTCPHCGIDLTFLHAFRELQRDVRQVNEDATIIATRLSHLQEKFDMFARRLDASLTNLVRYTPLAAAPQMPASSTASMPAGSMLEGEPAAVPPLPPEPLPVQQQAAEIRFGQKGLLIVGVAMTVLGIGFFLKYAFDQNWVGPAGRIALAYLAAGAFLGCGEWFRHQRVTTFGLYLIGGGIATLYLTTFAAFHLYSLLGQVPAFGFMVLVTILAGALALFYDAKWLAVLGLIGGFLTPVILSTGQDQQVVLMAYMAMLNGGILAIATRKRWSLLNTLGFILTWLLFAGWYASYYSDARFWVTTFFLHLFFLIYAFVPFVYYFVQASHERLAALTITVLNAFIAFGFSFAMIRAHTALMAVSIVTLAYASLFLGMANFLHRRYRENLEPFVLLLAKGLLFLIITVPILFSGHWITVFWAVQAVVLLWAALHVRNRWLCRGAMVLLLLAVGKFVLHDYATIFRLQYGGLWFWELYYARGYAWLWLERWVTTVVVLGVVLRSAQMLHTADAALQPWQGEPAGLIFGAWVVLTFVVLNYEVSAFFHDYASQAHFAAISVLWALCSIFLMVVGFLRNQALLRKGAIGLFAITVLKVFLADMANVSTPFRIISFVVLGLMLIGASYLYYRYRERILPTATTGNMPQ